MITYTNMASDMDYRRMGPTRKKNNVAQQSGHTPSNTKS